MSEKRKDSKGRLLRTGESQRKEGKYQYRYVDLKGERQTIYSWKLVPTDRVPVGKRDDTSLREKEEVINKKLEKGIYDSKITLNDMFDQYIIRKKYKGRSLNESTCGNYRGMWNKHIRSKREANKKVHEIKRNDIIAIYKGLQSEGVSYGTITFFNKLMNAVFNMALDDELILKNPVKRCINEICGNEKKRFALTRDQEEGLINFAKENDYQMYLQIVFLLDTMCRIGEYAGLTISDIDMKKRRINIDHQLKFYKKYSIAPPKSDCGNRTIPMSKRVYKIVKEIINNKPKEFEVDGYTDFLFYSKRGNLTNCANFNSSLKVLVNNYNKSVKSDLKIEYISAHILRHTGCTRKAEDGMDLKVIQYLMGHSSSKITNDVYNHVNVDRVENNMLRAGIIDL